MASFPGPIRIFHEVVRAGSVRAASETLGLSASSITRQIQVLEHQMGALLLERSSSGVSPTHAGKLVAEFARSVVIDYDTLRADINERRGVKGHIRIAAVESTIGKVVAAVSSLRSRHEGVSFTVVMLAAGRVVEAVKASEVDVGVTFCLAPDLDLTILARYLEPIVLVVNPNHDWAFRTSVSLRELVTVQLGLPDVTLRLRTVIDAAARRDGVQLTPCLVSNSFEALRGFARTGGACLLPRMSIEGERRANLLKVVLIDDPAFNETTADVIALRSRKPSRVLRLFYSELEQMSSG